MSTSRKFGRIAVFMKGMSMGAAHVVPGVSGGTMALITGIYEQLIASLRAFDLDFVRMLLGGDLRGAFAHVNGGFLAPLLLGILASVLSLAKLVQALLAAYPVQVWSLFFGLIVASVVVVSKRIGRWTPSVWVSLLAGAAAAYVLMGLVPVATPAEAWFVFLSGVASICAMILPGISGAHVLLILGKYRFILDALISADIGVLAVFLSGCCTGMLAFARLLNWLLGRWYFQTVAVLTGFMAGSLRKIWPWKETLTAALDRHGETVPLVQRNVLPSADAELGWAIIAAFAGALMVFAVERAGRTASGSEEPPPPAGLS